jgi:hypothetical protein
MDGHKNDFYGQRDDDTIRHKSTRTGVDSVRRSISCADGDAQLVGSVIVDESHVSIGRRLRPTTLFEVPEILASAERRPESPAAGNASAPPIGDGRHRQVTVRV